MENEKLIMEKPFVRNLIKRSLSNLYKHKYRYLLTAVVLQVFLATAGRSVLRFLLRFALEMAGVTSLTKDNFVDVFSQTVPFLLLVAYVLLVAGFILLEFTCLIYMVMSSYRNFEVRDMVKSVWNQLNWLSGPQIILFLLYLLLMIPLGNLGMSSSLLDHLRIPDFITGEISKMAFGNWYYGVVLLLVLYINLRLIYFLPLSVVNTATPWQNMRQSWRLTRKHKLKLLLAVGCLVVIVATLWLVFFLPVSFAFYTIEKAWTNIIPQAIFYSLVRMSYYGMTFLTRFLMIEVLVNVLFYSDQKDQSITYVMVSESPAKAFKYPKWSKWVVMLAVFVFIAYNGLQLYLVSVNKDALMIAHRGDITTGVENSIEALEGAHQKGADLVEMDVVMTVDQHLVVIHDNSLKRLAGVDLKVSELTLEELESLTLYQGQFKSQIESFESYYRRAKELEQPLLIELKPYGHEPDNYVALVVSELRRLGIRETDKVMSLDLEVMQELETEAPDVTTGYVIPIQFGNFDDQQVDFYVIEDFSYNDLVMWGAQKAKKDLYVWTINDSASMEHYLQSPVNGIITDDLELFKAEQADMTTDDTYFARVWRLLAMENK